MLEPYVDDTPHILDDVLQRVLAGESLDSAVVWVWFHASTATDRSAIDSWLVKLQHPLAGEPSTPEQRFRAICREHVTQFQEMDAAYKQAQAEGYYDQPVDDSAYQAPWFHDCDCVNGTCPHDSDCAVHSGPADSVTRPCNCSLSASACPAVPVTQTKA